MRYEVYCLTCDKPVDQMVKERDQLRRADIIVVWCHGKYAELCARDSILLDAAGFNFNGVIRLEAFPRPTKLIIDRDMGDEDPNEPWQGQTCQM